MIYDCFTFFNELDLLEIRMAELKDVVDRFVLVEATRTFTNRPKPLYFAENRERFDCKRIIHVVVERLPRGNLFRPHRSPWRRERYQRDCVFRGLTGARPNDTILLSDVDEIPRASQVAGYRVEQGPKMFEQIFSYYYVNCLADQLWHGTKIFSYEAMRRFKKTRRIRNGSFPVIHEGGWHFSYLGGVERIREKIAAFSHQEYNRAQYTDRSRILEVMAAGQDLFGRPMKFQFVPLDQRFPAYLRENRDRFRSLIYPLEDPDREPEGARSPGAVSTGPVPPGGS